MNQWMNLAMRVQSIAQAGLAYGNDEYDRERYEELRDIAAQMVFVSTDIPVETVKMHFCNEDGYQTPKVDTRAAVFRDGKILLVHEKMERGLCREAGVMSISPSHPILKKKRRRRRDLK